MRDSLLYAFAVFAILCSFAIPVLVLAEGEDASAEEVTVESPVQEPVAPTEAPPPPPPTAVPTVPPPPTAVPTLPPPPPTAVPPTAVPTQVPPTATVAPTATMAPTPTPEPTPTPSPTEVVWVNTDTMRLINGAGAHSMKPGGQETVTVRYNVTTPRAATVIHAELTGDVHGWKISSPTLADANASATKAEWRQVATNQPGASFNLQIVITAPADVTADQTVGLHVWTTASTDRGTETGVVKVTQPYARFTVVAPPPPTATEAPVVSRSVENASDAADDEDAERQEDGDGQEPGPVADATPQATPTVDEGAEGGSVPGDEPQDPDVSAAATPQASPAADQDEASGEQQIIDVEVAASPQASPIADLDDEPVGSPVPDVTNVATPQASPVVDSIPAEPTIACEPGEVENTFACHIDPDRDDVQEATITIAGVEGWEYEIDGHALPAAGTLGLADLVDDIAVPQSLDVTATFPEGCADTTSDPTASIEVELTYQDAEDELVETTFEPEVSLSDPAITISNYSFQDMNQRETLQSIGTLTLDVRDLPTTCGWQLQVEFEDFTSEDVTVPASYLQLVDVSGIEGSTAAMTDGVLRIILPASQGQSSEATLTIMMMVTFPSELPPGGYHTSVTVRAERLQ